MIELNPTIQKKSSNDWWMTQNSLNTKQGMGKQLSAVMPELMVGQ